MNKKLYYKSQLEMVHSEQQSGVSKPFIRILLFFSAGSSCCYCSKLVFCSVLSLLNTSQTFLHIRCLQTHVTDNKVFDAECY